MDYADEADAAKRAGEGERARELFSQALELETQAAEFADAEPARSILYRSAATLALDCKLHRRAEILAATGLVGSPPSDIAEELRDVIDRANFERHLSLKGEELTDDQLQLSLSGKVVSHGIILTEAFVQRIKDFELLVIRTAERMRQLPFREGGRPKQQIAESFSLYMSPARAKSYAVTLQVGVPADQVEQPELTLLSDKSQVIDELLECLTLMNEGEQGKLAERFREPAYYRNFVAVTKRFAPDGEQIKLVGLTRLRGNNEEQLGFVRPQETITNIPPDPSDNTRRGSVPITITGRLKYADDISKQEIKLLPLGDNKNAKTIIVPEGYMDDIVRPLWGSTVKVTGVKEGRKIRMVDISEIGDESTQSST